MHTYIYIIHLITGVHRLLFHHHDLPNKPEDLENRQTHFHRQPVPHLHRLEPGQQKRPGLLHPGPEDFYLGRGEELAGNVC